MGKGEFAYRRSITIQSSQIGGSCSSDLSNFPVLVSLSGTWLKDNAHGGHVESSSGYDIIFRDADMNQLDHEIEEYDGTNGTLVAWVRVPTVDYDANTTIYIYYGNPSITSSTENATGVWDSNYTGVYHLNETSGNYADSTSNGRDLTSISVTSRTAAAKIGSYAPSFSDADYIKLDTGDDNDDCHGKPTNITIEAWGKDSALGDGRNNLVDFDDVVAIRWGSGGTDNAIGYFQYDASSWDNLPNSSTGPYDGSWHYMAYVVDDTHNTHKLYIDDVETKSESISSESIYWSDCTAFGVAIHKWWSGDVDEIRVSNTARDACWIETSFNSMDAPSSFYQLGTETENPTAAEVAEFHAYRTGQGVLLSWKTGFELDNLGFHVYREQSGRRVQITPQLIAGSAFFAGAGTPMAAGRSYEWLDDAVSGHPAYWIEAIDLNGERAWHGPVFPEEGAEAIFAEGSRSALIGQVGISRLDREWKAEAARAVRARLLEKARKEAVGIGTGLKKGSESAQGDAMRVLRQRAGLLKRSHPRRRLRDALEMQWVLAAGSAVKIGVRQTGWYRVGQPELVAAGLASDIDPRRLHLFTEGQEVSILVTGGKDGRFDPGDAIEFYGTGLDTPSTDTRVYWLAEGDRRGKRVTWKRGRARGARTSQSFPYTATLKERVTYVPALKISGAKFFGQVVAADPVDLLLDVPHPDPSPPGRALLEISLQGFSQVEHRVRILFNDTEVGELQFSNQDRGAVQLEIDPGVLLEGQNLVTLEAQGGETDISLVDTIRLTYWRTYTADDNALQLTARGGQRVAIDGFQSPGVRVMDVTRPERVWRVRCRGYLRDSLHGVRFRAPGHGLRHLIAFAEDRVKEPAWIRPNEPSEWHGSDHGADLVVISNGEYVESVLPLKALRETQGFSVALIDVEDLYDEFNYGHKDPQSLKDFLRYARDHWETAPRYLLLVGDASYDPRDYQGFGNFDDVPTKLVQTGYLETASDDWFADFDGDWVPEMAVGRLPVHGVGEAQRIVSKILDYERATQIRKALLVADENEGYDFEGASRQLAGLLPQDVEVQEIYRGRLGTQEARARLMEALDTGALLVNYMGHGSMQMWNDGLLENRDALATENGRQMPFFVNMTCLNGFFQAPYGDSLAEALLKAESGGAVAVWASSGFTLPSYQSAMNRELFGRLFGGEPMTIGRAVIWAKKAISDTETRKSWILFGDPTMRLQ